MRDLETVACNYFLLLSSVEYALKRSGFVASDKNDNAQPDWNSFKDDVYERMNIDMHDPDIKEIIRQRPARQLYKDGQLKWSEPQKIGENDKKALIDACLTIRNNLFHGGKHGDGNAGRNDILIRAATKIIEAAVEANKDVEEQLRHAEL